MYVVRAAKDAGYCSTATDVKKSSFGPFILLTIERLIKVTHTKINNIFLKLLLFLFNNILEKIIQTEFKYFVMLSSYLFKLEKNKLNTECLLKPPSF